MALTPKDAARRVGLTIEELKEMRESGDGPRWMGLPRGLIRYDDTELDEWAAAR